MSEATGAIPVANIEALKRLKEVETAWETKLAQTRSDVAARVAIVRGSAEKAIQAARVEMDRTRETRLAGARAQSQVEAERILSEGQRAAQALDAAAVKGAEAIRPKMLEIVLGEFRSESGGK